jgi:DNA-binding HxlR family transcriptional regulator
VTEPTDLSPFCPRYFRAVEIIGRRWTGAIVRALLAGTCHFSEIAAVIPGLSDRLLAERLKELEAEEIVERTVIPETPVRIEYHLTDKGTALAGVVDALSMWAEDWLASPAESEAAPRSSPDGRAAGHADSTVDRT